MPNDDSVDTCLYARVSSNALNDDWRQVKVTRATCFWRRTRCCMRRRSF